MLTLKSNGCIIFIAPLTSSKLLITSKHSIGPIKGQEQSHAEVGERWLRKHLESVGKTEADIAKVLWNNNWTAVAEVSVVSIVSILYSQWFSSATTASKNTYFHTLRN